MRLIHLSDPHLSSLHGVKLRDLLGKRTLGYQSWYRKRRHQYTMDTLRRVTRAVRNEAADAIVVTGDLVHLGMAQELRQAREWLESVGGPDRVLVIPGNHDCYHRQSWALVKETIGPYLALEKDTADARDGYPLVRRSGEASVIAAGTAEPTAWWSASGSLGAAQTTRLEDALIKARETFTFLAIHHPPLPGMAPRRKSLRDAHALAELLERHAPDVVLHGHLHANQENSDTPTRIFCTAPPSSERPRAPASYRVFDVVEDASGYRVVMRLKSLIGEEMVVADEQSWTSGRSLDPGERDDAAKQ
ncbi:MAG TPA: metallophosphoesterase [Pseudomonadales bacterium]|jgi:3',5'-cyclic AMP phosphodiesterase CpdA